MKFKTIADIYKHVGKYPFVVKSVEGFDSSHYIIIGEDVNGKNTAPNVVHGTYYNCTTLSGQVKSSRWGEFPNGWILIDPMLDNSFQSVKIEHITIAPPCTCGGEKTSGTHYHWCDSLQKVG